MIDLMRSAVHTEKKIKISFEVLPCENIKNKLNPTETEKFLLKTELAGIEHIDQFIQINADKSGTLISKKQVSFVLSYLGFLVNPLVEGTYKCDLSAVLNINGFTIPLWSFIFSKFPEHLKKIFLLKIAPGKNRLHLRFYKNEDKNWIITPHTDYNWISLNILKVVKAHLKKGSGNYHEGVNLTRSILELYNQSIELNKIIESKDILKLVK